MLPIAEADLRLRDLRKRSNKLDLLGHGELAHGCIFALIDYRIHLAVIIIKIEIPIHCLN